MSVPDYVNSKDKNGKVSTYEDLQIAISNIQNKNINLLDKPILLELTFTRTNFNRLHELLFSATSSFLLLLIESHYHHGNN